MHLFTAAQMRAADAATAQAGIPLLLLMEEAGHAVADAARRGFPDAERVLVLCGKGNNGGDGYVAARHLRERTVDVLELADTPGSAESRTMRTALLAHGLTPQPLTPETLKAGLRDRPLVIDALFGSGLTRPLEGKLADIITMLNGSGLGVLSVDVPSGLSSDSGEALGPHVRATRTLQLAGAKVASVFHPAQEAYGKQEVADVGIPAAVLAAHSSARLLTLGAVRQLTPTRGADTHKYAVGTVLVIAGSARYLGAAEMACRAAFRGGAGLVTLIASGSFLNTWPELIHERLGWDDRPLEAIANIGDNRAQVRVIGPGLDRQAEPLLTELIAQKPVPTVLDAGALTGGEAWFAAVRAHGRCVLTPHTGEAGKLLGRSTAEIRKDPLGAARDLARKSRAVAVLKGATTVVAAPDGRLSVHSGGHPGMATGGTGDVLAGFLGAWCAGCQDANALFDRAGAAVWVHARAGALAAGRYGDGLVASDVIEQLPQAWLELS